MKIAKTSLFCVLLFLILPNYLFANQYSLTVFPKDINAGDTVRIDFIDQHQPIKNYAIQIISPTGKVYNMVPHKQSESKGQVLFSQTYDRGFLTDNWNQYKIKLYNSKNVFIDSTDFFLKNNNKQLYFTIYIDDIGRVGYLSEDGERWFKSIGGKINYGYQHDDKGGILLGPVLKRYNNKDDYIFHHFHAWEFSGNRSILKLDGFLKWNHRKHLVNNFTTIPLRDRHYIAILGLLLILFAAICIYRKNKTTKIVLISVTALFFLMLIAVLSSHYAKAPDNWEIKLGDIEWCKEFLLTAKKEFQKNGLEYPEITRHGWNTPPRGLNRFYVNQMGVIADASMIYPNVNKYGSDNAENDYGVILNQVRKFNYNWPDKISLPLPYYTNINGDIDTVWNGKEGNRGLLEIPLTIDNIGTYGFDETDKKIIDRLPNGALVSTYIHPGQDLRKIKEVISYIENNYTLLFISAKDYLDLYLRQSLH